MSVEMVSAAMPLLMGAVPRTVALSRKVTVPVALTGMVAVKMTGVPAKAGVAEVVRATVGVACATSSVPFTKLKV